MVVDRQGGAARQRPVGAGPSEDAPSHNLAGRPAKGTRCPDRMEGVRLTLASGLLDREGASERASLQRDEVEVSLCSRSTSSSGGTKARRAREWNAQPGEHGEQTWRPLCVASERRLDQLSLSGGGLWQWERQGEATSIPLHRHRDACVGCYCSRYTSNTTARPVKQESLRGDLELPESSSRARPANRVRTSLSSLFQSPHTPVVDTHAQRCSPPRSAPPPAPPPSPLAASPRSRLRSASGASSAGHSHSFLLVNLAPAPCPGDEVDRLCALGTDSRVPCLPRNRTSLAPRVSAGNSSEGAPSGHGQSSFNKREKAEEERYVREAVSSHLPSIGAGVQEQISKKRRDLSLFRTANRRRRCQTSQVAPY